MPYEHLKSERRLRDLGQSLERSLGIWLKKKRLEEQRRAAEEKTVGNFIYSAYNRLLGREPGGVAFRWLDNEDLICANELIPGDSWAHHLLQHAEQYGTIKKIHQCNDVLAFVVDVQRPGSFCWSVPSLHEHWVQFCCIDLFTIERLGAVRETPRPLGYRDQFEYEVWADYCDYSHWPSDDLSFMWTIFQTSCD